MAGNRKRWRTDGMDLVGNGPGGSGLANQDHGSPCFESGLADQSPMEFPPQIPETLRAPKDSVVYLGAPPIAGDAAPIPEYPALDRLKIVPHQPPVGGRQESASWMGSLLIHGIVLILIALLIAPADFSGRGSRSLIVTLSDQATEIPAPVLLVNEIADDDSSLLSEKEDLPEPVDPVLMQMDIGRPVVKIGGSKSLAGRAAGDLNGGSRGSFFGIETVGQEFVYVVDRSSSMEGMRYQRAISELKRSIRELRPDQKFFVILFCNSSLPMFDGEQGMQMMPATEENKQRFDDWISTISTSGGTQPMESVRASLQMSPNAIFMLSDGEFIEKKSRKRAGILSAGRDTLSIVQASGSRIPIHAIAFEDPRSCANMEQIANISGGQYRFVDSLGKTEAELAAESSRLLLMPTGPERSMLQSELCQDYDRHGTSDAARKDFAQQLASQFEQQYGPVGIDVIDRAVLNIDETSLLLKSLAQIDPNRDACADLQDEYAGQLSRRLRSTTDLNQRAKTCDAILSWPGSPAVTAILDRLADHYVAISENDIDAAFERLEAFETKHPNSTALAECRKLCDRLHGQSMATVNRLVASGELATAISMLRTMNSSSTTQRVRVLIDVALKDLTVQQLIAMRDAFLRRDVDSIHLIEQQLRLGFGDDPLLAKIKKERASIESDARTKLQQALVDIPYATPELKRERLEAMINLYPDTVAALQGKQHLDRIMRLNTTENQFDAELIRLMDDTIPK